MRVSMYVERLVSSPGRELEGVRLELDTITGLIAALEDNRARSREDIVFTSPAVCIPALINSHDHLKYTWPTHIGKPPYEDSYEWLPLLYQEAQAQFLSFLEIDDLYWLGTYKTILGGSTTVANHCRRFPRSHFSRFPIRILEDFAREIFVHVDARAHQMGAGPKEEAESARRANVPFVIHLAEGTNKTTAEELEYLDRIGGLFENTVLVHGLNISDKDARRIRLADASIVWCPVSNGFLFERNAPIKTFLSEDINIALGTDSTCTGSETLLSEMRVALEDLTGWMSVSEAAELVFSFVTVNAARALKVSDNMGRVSIGSIADLLVFEGKNENPYVSLLGVRPEDILLLTREGKWLLTEQRIARRLPPAMARYSSVLVGNARKAIVGDPVKRVQDIARKCHREPEFFPLGQQVKAI